MSKQSLVKPSGLSTYPNALSEVPPGALLEATNVVIDKPSIIGLRRGFDNFATLGASVTQCDQLTDYQDHLIGSVRTDAGGKLGYLDDSDIFQLYPGNYDVPDPTNPESRVRFSQSNKNLYLTSSNGIQKLDVYTGPPLQAGAPRALGGTGVTTGSDGFLPDQTNVAYRVVWGYRDENDNLILGVPSQRIIVSNTSGTAANVDLSFQVPAIIDETWFYQVYRSTASVDLATPPDDELQQVYEDNPTSGEISAGEVTITDSTPDDLRQAALYTNPTQQGFENANFEPPFAQDVTLFRGCLIYANTRLKQNLTFTLIAAGAPDGLQVGDIIGFVQNSPGTGTFLLEGAVTENVAANQFQVYDSGTPSENITNTANSIVRVLNRVTDNTFLDGYYASGFDELPGRMQLVTQSFADTGFYVVSSRGSAFTPILPLVGTSFQSEAEVAPNRIYVSKPQQPEAVPLYQYFDVGSAALPIQRVLALRESVLILKQDGVFRLYGSAFADFSVATLDNNVRIRAANSAVTLVNQVFFFSDQGIVAASDQGVAVISRPVEADLLRLSSSIYPDFSAASHATAYESDRKYIFWTVTEPTDTRATRAFVFNVFTDSWTTWDRQPTVGYVSTVNDKLYLGYYSATGSAPLAVERKDFTRLDYADDSFELSLLTVSGDEVTVADATNVVPGMTLKQGDLEALVEQVVGNTLVLSAALPWDTGELATVYTPIPLTVLTVPISGQTPLGTKRFRELNVALSDASFNELTVGFKTDLYPEVQNVDVAANPVLGQLQNLRTYVPRNYTLANYLQLRFYLSQAFTSVGINGYALDEQATLTRFR